MLTINFYNDASFYVYCSYIVVLLLFMFTITFYKSALF